MSGTLTWSFSITTGWGTIGAVTVTTSDVPDGNGDYYATAISGTWDSQPIIALDTSFNGADNFLSIADPSFSNGLDGAGISFTTTHNGTGIWVNIYSNGPTDFQTTEIDSPTGLNYSYYQSGQATSVTFASACYMRGTHIRTVNGDVAVENLRIGDLVITKFGNLRPVKWIGQQAFLGRFLRRHRSPVCILPGALGPNTPYRALYVSPDHSLMVGGRLVHASLLVNGINILQEERQGHVDYFHVDLGTHDCVLAEGAWAESYAEMNNRNMFSNCGEAVEEFGGAPPRAYVMCLPQVRGEDAVLLDLKKSLVEFLPPDSLTVDPDLHLVADGFGLESQALSDGRWLFDIPPGTRLLRLVSRTCQPSMLGLSPDSRHLGVCITTLTAQTHDTTTVFFADSPELHSGFHAVETSLYRWTDGNAELPKTLFNGCCYPTQMVVTGYTLPHYLTSCSPSNSNVLDIAR